MTRGLAVLLLLLAVGYVGINLVGLPPLLVAENLMLAAAYTTAAVLLWRGARRIYPLLAALLAFNAGRVSRTVWSPAGGFGELALEHLPLLLYLLITLALVVKLQLREFS